VVRVVLAGFDVDWVLDLDILSFDSLVGSIYRIQSQEKFEGTWLQRYACQAEQKDFNKAMKPLEKAMTRGTDRPRPGAKGAKDFVKKYGRGV
jgi:hypothetical protein